MAQKKLQCWSLAGFAKLHGKMYVFPVKEFVNSETGESFESQECGFKKDSKWTYVRIANALGLGITAKDVVSKQKDLQILKGSDSKFYLCPVVNGQEVELDMEE